MTVKNLTVILVFVLSLFAGICTGMLTARRAQPSDTLAAEEVTTPLPDPTPFVEPEPPRKTSVSEKYMVTLSDNKLFIYKISPDGSMQIVEEKDTDANSLRREDYEALFRGITFDTLTEARELVEDYVN